MLIRFSVENYKSFRDRVEFSMVPGRVRSHPTHVVKPASGNDIGVLKTGIIYVANASGKSNLINAMWHVQKMVTRGDINGKNIPYHPFRLEDSFDNKPSRFEFEIKVGSRNYAYGFVADQKAIYEEWLFEINKARDTLIFERKNISAFIFDGFAFKNKEDEQFLTFVARGTSEKRLFLYECFERNVFRDLKYIYQIVDVGRWFRNQLQIIFPNSKYRGLELTFDSTSEKSELFAKVLEEFDTGISKLSLIEVDFLKDIQLAETIKNKLIEEIGERESVIVAAPNNKRYKVSRDDSGKILAYKLMSAHKNKDGKDIYFELNQESDGTQRLLDIVPGLLELLSKEKVYVIDEIDRSLHPEITNTFMKMFLSITKNNKSQLVVTTHESGLLNLDLIRRDEIWFTEKNKDGVSKLYSLEEFQPRFDKDIRKGYLIGRFGGIPKIKNMLSTISDIEKDSNVS